MEARVVAVFNAVFCCGSWIAPGVFLRLRPCCNLVLEVLFVSVEARILLAFHGRSGRVRGGSGAVEISCCRSVLFLGGLQEFVHVRLANLALGIQS